MSEAGLGVACEGVKLLTSRQVAVALQCSERLVWGWTKDGDLPAVRLGRLVRYRIDDVEEFIARHQGG
jgi:excisionase family DNA binding protein